MYDTRLQIRLRIRTKSHVALGKAHEYARCAEYQWCSKPRVSDVRYVSRVHAPFRICAIHGLPTPTR